MEAAEKVAEKPEQPEKAEQSEQAKKEEEAKAKAKAKAKAAANKSPEAIERDERLEANFKLYEHLTEEELKEVLPKKADGGFTSIGAMLHASGKCATCIFHHSPKGCYNAIKCRFCHGDHTKPSRAKSRKKKKPEEGDENAQKAAAGSGPQRQKKARGDGDDDEPDAKKRRNGSSELDELGNSKPSWIAAGEESYPYRSSRPPPSPWGGHSAYAAAYPPYAYYPPRDSRPPADYYPPPAEPSMR
mmetsp:Transcript_5934/g.10753  ORF Transcript_5934/g.10753 Transcript_5934/m.10753 type:complete len:244 (+) Transcript_5934:110-841(+)